MAGDIRFCDSLQESRRVLTHIKGRSKINLSVLASVQQKINVSSLSNNFPPRIVLAAKDISDDDIPLLGGGKRKKVTAPAKKPAPAGKSVSGGKKAAPTKAGKGKLLTEKQVRDAAAKESQKSKNLKSLTTRGKTAPEVDDAEEDATEENEDPKPQARKSGSSRMMNLRVRGGGDTQEQGLDTEELDAANLDHVEKTTKVLRDAHSLHELAENMHHNLMHNPSTSNTAKRLRDMAQELMNEQKTTIDSATGTLRKIAENNAPRVFVGVFEDLFEKLDEELSEKASDVTKDMMVTTGTYENAPATFYIGYITLKGMRLPRTDKRADQTIVVTHVISNTAFRPSLPEIQKVVDKNKNPDRKRPAKMPGATAENFVRVWPINLPPSNVARNNLGDAFGHNVDRAVRLIFIALQAEGLMTNIDPIAIPIPSHHLHKLKSTSDLIDDLKIDDKEAKIRVYAKPGMTKERAEKAFTDIYLELKKVLKVFSPRFRQSVQMSPISFLATKKMDKVTKKAAAPIKRWVSDFTFSKAVGMADKEPHTFDMNAAHLQPFMDAFGITDPDYAREAMMKFKRVLGLSK